MSKKTTKHHNPSVFLKKQSECDKGTIFPKDRQSFVPSTRYSLVQNSKPTTPTASRIKFALKSCPENCGPSLSTPRRPRKKLRKTHPKILGSPDRDTYFAADSSLANSMSSRLLSLPAEIRFIIWELALTSDSGELHFDSKTKRFDVSSIGAGLLTTCSETAYETQYLPLKLNKLVFEVPTKVNVDFMVFLRRLKRIEDSLGWIMDINVKFKQKAENKREKDDITVEMSPVMTRSPTTRGTAG